MVVVLEVVALVVPKISISALIPLVQSALDFHANWNGWTVGGKGRILNRM